VEGLIHPNDVPGNLVREHRSGEPALHCHSCGTFGEGRPIIGSVGCLECNGKKMLLMNDMRERTAANKCADERSGEEGVRDTGRGGAMTSRRVTRHTGQLDILDI